MYQATEEDKVRSKKIISEEFEKYNLNISDKELDERVIEVLDISNSIGGGYDENIIRKITQSLIKRM
jgi:hypothetical protein